MDAMTCPAICPATKKKEKEKKYKQAGGSRRNVNPFASPYTPGNVKPPEKKQFPPDAPPRYLPQPSESTSGDILGMGPVGPWAPGHMDWSPQAGMTGVRPVVDKYSITRYSTGDWRKNNQFILTPKPTNKAKALDSSVQDFMKDAFKKEDEKQALAHKKLKERAKELAKWEMKAKNAVKAIAEEIETLDQDRTKLKGACRILMMPEAISRECLELRTHRYEPDLVRDDAEQELIKEVAIVGEIRKLFQETLAKVETQLENNRAAKANLEYDWDNKMTTLTLDSKNIAMGKDSTLLMFHPGVARWPENATSLEYWEHYCSESIRNCEEVRNKSIELRGLLQSVIKDGSQDMKLQADRTNVALAEKISATQQMCAKLEETLKDNLKTLVNIENLIDKLNEASMQVHARNKLVMTRLFSRNYDRQGVENCRDEAQYALMDESKYIKETVIAINDKLREAENVRNELLKYRGDLEKDIACKRKSLNLDEDRLARVRAHMPPPEEFAAISMVAGVAVYPAGWSETAVQETCGPTADQYNLGRCHIRWAYLLAVIGCLDGIVLSALAFILATRHVRLQPDSGYPPPSLYKGEVNNGYVTDATSVSGSRKSLALQPVLIMHPHAAMDMDTYSHYSGRTARSKHGIYANTMHNYQL